MVSGRECSRMYERNCLDDEEGIGGECGLPSSSKFNRS